LRYLKFKGTQYGWNVVDRNHRIKPVEASELLKKEKENEQPKDKIKKGFKNMKNKDTKYKDQKQYYATYDQGEVLEDFADYNNYYSEHQPKIKSKKKKYNSEYDTSNADYYYAADYSNQDDFSDKTKYTTRVVDYTDYNNKATYNDYAEYAEYPEYSEKSTNYYSKPSYKKSHYSNKQSNANTTD
jgi:hypothetical protein